MIYISIPENCTFISGQVDATGEGRSTNHPHDCFMFTKKGGTYRIDLQEIVKDALRSKTHKAQEKTIYCDDNECYPNANHSINTYQLAIVIYHKYPPANQDLVLRYKPNENGTRPAKEVEIVSGISAQAKIPQTSAVKGTLWYRLDPGITLGRREELDAKAAAQRESRRNKIADNPFSV